MAKKAEQFVIWGYCRGCDFPSKLYGGTQREVNGWLRINRKYYDNIKIRKPGEAY